MQPCTSQYHEPNESPSLTVPWKLHYCEVLQEQPVAATRSYVLEMVDRYAKRCSFLRAHALDVFYGSNYALDSKRPRLQRSMSRCAAETLFTAGRKVLLFYLTQIFVSESALRADSFYDYLDDQTVLIV